MYCKHFVSSRNNSQQALQLAAHQIAQNNGVSPYSKTTAIRKLFVQERRDFSVAGAPQVGWKRGELFEVVEAVFKGGLDEEWGDVGYYVAQSFNVLWNIYEAITPKRIIEHAIEKFNKRSTIKFEELNRFIFSLLITKHGAVRGIHPALMLYIEQMKDNPNSTMGIDDFVLNHCDAYGIKVKKVLERGKFESVNVHDAIISEQQREKPVTHPDNIEIARRDALAMRLMDALLMWRKGLVEESWLREEANKYKEAY